MWKTGTGEFSFCEKPESENFFCFNPEFSFCGKRELENSRFVENQNRRIFFFFYPRILVLWKRRILVLWKKGTGEFSFCEKPESENFFFFLTQNSRFMENGNWRILVLWKTRIGEFFFFFYPRILILWKRGILVLWKTGTGEFSFCEKPESENFVFFFFNPEFPFYGKQELENSRLVENQNRRIFFFFLTQNSRFVENGKWRTLVLWKT